MSYARSSKSRNRWRLFKEFVIGGTIFLAVSASAFLLASGLMYPPISAPSAQVLSPSTSSCQRPHTHTERLDFSEQVDLYHQCLADHSMSWTLIRLKAATAISKENDMFFQRHRYQQLIVQDLKRAAHHAQRINDHELALFTALTAYRLGEQTITQALLEHFAKLTPQYLHQWQHLRLLLESAIVYQRQVASTPLLLH